MSKSILVIDTPNCCGECELCGKWNIKDLKTFPKDCPLKDLPERKEDVEIKKNSDYSESFYIQGYNACIDDILKGVNIVYNTTNDGWIPCNKRLPLIPKGADSQEFIVMINGASEPTALMCDSDRTWFDDDGNIYDVIAWQMFPEPYIG